MCVFEASPAHHFVSFDIQRPNSKRFMFKFRLVMFDGRVDDRAGSPHDPEVQLVILQTLSDGTGTSSLPSASGRSDPDPR